MTTQEWLIQVEAQLAEIAGVVSTRAGACPREVAIVKRYLDDARVWSREIAKELAQPA